MTSDNVTPLEKPKRQHKQRDLSRPLEVLTASQQKTLLLLARYRYMTVRQLVACGVAKRPETVRRDVLPRLSRLAGQNLVQAEKYIPLSISRGRMSYVYALTAKGAEVAAEILRCDPSAVRYPIGGIQFVNDHEHREAYIDLCITLDAWIAGHPDRFCRSLTHYFDKDGANRKGTPSRSVNRLELPAGRDITIPDGLALVDTETKRRALVLELHHKTSTKQIAEQLVKHMHALAAGVIERRLGHDKSPFILSVATAPGDVALIRKRMAGIPGIGPFAPVFLFNDLPTIMQGGFAQGWTHVDGEPATIFS